MDKTTSAIMATLCLSGTAAARVTPEFASFDEDTDGYVSREHARVVPEIIELFARVDPTQDGTLKLHG